MDAAGNSTYTTRQMKTFGFGLRAMTKYWELVPLAAIISTALFGVGAFTIYAAATKPDVRINRRNPYQPYESVDFEKPQKLITINQKYRKIPELEELRKDIGSFKY